MSYQKVQALLNKGISRPTLYQVIIPGVSRKVNDQLEFLVKQTRVPEVSSISVVASGHEAMGVVREQPVRVSYASPFSVTVISDRDYTVYKAMREWFDSCVQNSNPFFLSQSSANQRVNYYTTFVREITLKKLEMNVSDGDTEGYFQPFEVVFHNAYPIRVGEIGLSSESRDSRVEFSVEFAYETYTLDTIEQIVPVN